jgi:hypothetical protein
MDSRTFVCTLIAALAFAAPAVADEPTAAQKETARDLMQDGRDLRDAGDLKGALQRFLAADQIMHLPPTGFEVANTQAALGQLVEARETLVHVLNIPVSPKEPIQFRQARDKAQALDEALATRIPTVTVIVKNGTNAKLTIDEVPVPATLVGLPLRMNPGHHVIGASIPTARGEAQLDVVENDKKEVVIRLVDKSPEELASSPPPNAAPSDKHGSYLPAVIGFGLAGAGLVVGGITGGLTLSKQSDLAAACPNHICGPANHGDVDSAAMLGTISTVSFIAAGACAAVGVVFLFVWKPSSQAAVTAWVRPWLGYGAGGIGGRF